MSDQTSSVPGQDTTRELATLITTLASGVLAFSVTFVEKITNEVGALVLIVEGAWVLLALSIFFAIRALSQLVHTQKADTLDWGRTTLPPLRKAWWLFQFGMGVLLLYGAAVSWLGARSYAGRSERTLLLENTSGLVQLVMIRDSINTYVVDSVGTGKDLCWSVPQSAGTQFEIRLSARTTIGSPLVTVTVDTVDVKRQSLRLQIHEPAKKPVLDRRASRPMVDNRTTIVAAERCHDSL